MDSQDSERQRPPLTLRTRKALAHVLAVRLARDTWTADHIDRRLAQHVPNKATSWMQGTGAALMQSFPAPVAPEAAHLARQLADMAQVDRLFRFCRKNGIWPDVSLDPPKFCPAPAFADLDLPPLATTAALADWLMLPAPALAPMADPANLRPDHDEMPVNQYFSRLIRKSGGGMRLIEAPKPRLKALQRRILRGILTPVPVHPDCYAFVPGRDCRTAAARHAGEALVIRFDLRDFFWHVGRPRVFGLFRMLGYPSAVAHTLTALSTTVTPARIRNRLPFDRRQILRGAHLPQGAPTSPALANLVCFGLDRRLSGLARSLGATYTRYADDLTFSGDRVMAKALLQAVPQIIRDEGFAPNPEKTRVMPAATRQTVTGIVVNQHLNIPRRDFDRLKATVHAGHWRSDPALQARLLGQIGWVAQLNPAKGRKLWALMARAQDNQRA